MIKILPSYSGTVIISLTCHLLSHCIWPHILTHHYYYVIIIISPLTFSNQSTLHSVLMYIHTRYVGTTPLSKTIPTSTSRMSKIRKKNNSPMTVPGVKERVMLASQVTWCEGHGRQPLVSHCSGASPHVDLQATDPPVAPMGKVPTRGIQTPTGVVQAA